MEVMAMELEHLDYKIYHLYQAYVEKLDQISTNA